MDESDARDWAEFQEFKAWKLRRASAVVPAPAPSVPEQTIAALWSAWYPTVADGSRGPNIRTHRRYVLELEFIFQGRVVTLSTFTPSTCTLEVLEAWRAKLRTVKNIRGTILAPDYRDGIRLSLQAMFSYHVKVETHPALRRNPLKGLPREKGWKGRKRMGYPTREFLEKFTAYCRPIVADFFWLSFEAGGMRRDEMRLLRKNEYDRATKTLNLQADRNKNEEARSIILNQAAAAIVERWMAVSPGEYVFGNPLRKAGKAIPKSTLWSWMDEARTLARADGMDVSLAGDNVCFHHSRHGFTMRMQGVMPESWTADQLGHTTTEMIHQRYGRLRGEEAREKARAMLEGEPAHEKPPEPRKPPHPAKRAAPLNVRVGKLPRTSRP